MNRPLNGAQPMADGSRCIETPLGTVGLLLDGTPCDCTRVWEVADASDYTRRHPVDGNWRLAYWYEPGGSAHTLECRLDPCRACDGGPASGERLEAVEVDDGRTVLAIAVEHDFEDSGCGYSVVTDALAVTVSFPAGSKARWMVFGVSWLEGYDEDSRVNPWLMGDPGGDRDRLPEMPRPVESRL